jgi:2-polyprenyl-6-methoxyphenol hydroxylase-like FAD-dependent oxidoreductase
MRLQRAVVVGAGMAGLTMARVLADVCEDVLVLDRDELPAAATPRRGVPQSHHVHVLLAAGQQALEQLFPGLRDEVVDAGATPFDPGSQMRFHRYGTVWPPISVGLSLISLSRPLLELTVRSRVQRLPNVTIRPGTAVAGLTGAAGRIDGVIVDDQERIGADLVVDCSGRGSRSDRWLAELGFPAPAVDQVRVGVAYSSRLLGRRPGDLAEVGAFVLPTPPAQKRAGVVLPIEGDRWLVSLGGWHGERPADGTEGFREYAQSLPDSAIADLLTRCEPRSDPVSLSFPASRWRRFDRLREVPAGYLAAGDAVCSFNPVYGQGMTCAALQAVALGTELARRDAATPALARDFYRAAAKVIRTPWQFAVGGDFGFPETTGARPRGIGLLNGYSRRIQLAAQVSAEVRRTFTSVQHLIAPPSVLFRPAMLARVLRDSARATRLAGPSPPPVINFPA